MDDVTIRRLNFLNQQFYTQNALTFSSSRSYSWPSWEKFWQESAYKEANQASFLDLGCGNGRLAQFVAEKLSADEAWTYAGWDSAGALLPATRSTLQLSVQFQVEDIVEILLEKQVWPTDVSYSIVALFGVMHHIPSARLRQLLLQRIWNELIPVGGELWLTLWDPQRYNLKIPAMKSDPDDSKPELEKNDMFLGWQSTKTVRYVHFISPEEEAQLLQPLQCSKVVAWDTIERGERGNRCLLLTK